MPLACSKTSRLEKGANKNEENGKIDNDNIEFKRHARIIDSRGESVLQEIAKQEVSEINFSLCEYEHEFESILMNLNSGCLACHLYANMCNTTNKHTTFNSIVIDLEIAESGSGHLRFLQILLLDLVSIL